MDDHTESGEPDGTEPGGFDPPNAADRRTNTEPSAASDEAPTSKRPLIAIAAAGLVGLAVVGGWLAWRGRTDPDPPEVEDVLRLPTLPKKLYETKLDADFVIGVSGSPDHVLVDLGKGEDQRSAIMFDGEGDERWRRPVGLNDGVQQLVDVVLFTSYGDDRTPVAVVDPDSGDELWSTSVPELSNAQIVGGQVLLVSGSALGDATLTLHDAATGDTLAERTFNSITQNLVTPPSKGFMLGWDDAETFVLDEQLQNVGEPIPVDGSSSGVAYMNDEIAVARDGTLTRYGLDGNVIASAPFDATVDAGIDVVTLVGVEGSTWMYFDSRGCGAVDVSGEQLKTLWEIEDCVAATVAQVAVRYGDSDPFALVRIGETRASVINATNGQTVLSTDEAAVEPSVNGFLEWGPTEVVAREMPSGDGLYSVQLEDGKKFAPLDNGYVIMQEDGDGIVMTVYG